MLSTVNVHEPIMLLQGLYCTLASENKFYDFTCTFTVALVQDYMRQSMMIIVLFDAKTQSFSCKTFSFAASAAKTSAAKPSAAKTESVIK